MALAKIMKKLCVLGHDAQIRRAPSLERVGRPSNPFHSFHSITHHSPVHQPHTIESKNHPFLEASSLGIIDSWKPADS